MIARSLLLALGIVAGPWLAVAASADPVPLSSLTTPMLVKACEESRSTLAADLCTGYVAATYDALTLSGLICPVLGVSTQQVIAIGRKYLPSRPEDWHLPPSIVLKGGFTAAFPCAAR